MSLTHADGRYFAPICDLGITSWDVKFPAAFSVPPTLKHYTFGALRGELSQKNHMTGAASRTAMLRGGILRVRFSR